MSNSLLTQSNRVEQIPPGFVDLFELMPDVEFDLRYFGEDNFVGSPIDGYLGQCCLLTKEAATALKGVYDDLGEFGLGMKIFDAYRPQRAVDHFVRWANDLNDIKMKAQYYPTLDKQDIIEQGYIVPKSGHSRGSTLDLTITSCSDETSHELDMGTHWDYFGLESWPSFLGLSAEQRANRLLLQGLMKAHGFKSLKQEWWHFTLIDEPYPDTYFDFVIS